MSDFVKAIKRDNSRKVASLLKSGSVDVNARLPCRNNPPPLVLAARRGLVEIVEMLLKAGARIDDTDEKGRTACHAAAIHGSVDVMAVLLAHRPNLEISSERHKTPLKCSLRCFARRISVMLINAGASFDGVRRQQLCALASGSSAAIQALLNRGVDINRLGNRQGWTPLHMAAARRPWSADCDAVVSALTNVCGIDVNARTSSGTSCIQLAVHNYDALRCFISAGADVNSLDDVGRPLLHRVVFILTK